ALYGAPRRAAGGARAKCVPVAVFTAVYLGLWAASGVPVYFAHTLVMTLPGSALGYGIAVILLAAGAFQLSPLKRVCLRECRSPLAFLLGHWRAGRRGSLSLGWAHAMYCLGCCWALLLGLGAAGGMGLGGGAREFLSRMLRGAHAGARRRRRDGPRVGAPHHGRGGGREAAPGRGMVRTGRRRGAPAARRDGGALSRLRDGAARRSPDVTRFITGGG